jgi:hypothetical protein
VEGREGHDRGPATNFQAITLGCILLKNTRLLKIIQGVEKLQRVVVPIKQLVVVLTVLEAIMLTILGVWTGKDAAILKPTVIRSNMMPYVFFFWVVVFRAFHFWVLLPKKFSRWPFFLVISKSPSRSLLGSSFFPSPSSPFQLPLTLLSGSIQPTISVMESRRGFLFLPSTWSLPSYSF